MGLHECLPGSDDPCRVAADVSHIGEGNALGLSPQLPAENVNLRSAHDDEYRVACVYRPADERHRSGKELGHARVQKSLVPVPAYVLFQ
jgi:hypothetical protein